MLYKIKPIMHVLASSIIGSYVMVDAFQNSRTTQGSRQEIINNPKIRNQIIKRHNTMNQLGVDMSHVNIK